MWRQICIRYYCINCIINGYTIYLHKNISFVLNILSYSKWLYNNLSTKIITIIIIISNNVKINVLLNNNYKNVKRQNIWIYGSVKIKWISNTSHFWHALVFLSMLFTLHIMQLSFFYYVIYYILNSLFLLT